MANPHPRAPLPEGEGSPESYLSSWERGWSEGGVPAR